MYYDFELTIIFNNIKQKYINKMLKKGITLV